MVSLESVASLLATTTATAKMKERPAASVLVGSSLPKRRKYHDEEEEEEEAEIEDDDDDRFFLTKMPKIARVGATGAEFGLEDADEDPLPLEWQQCLDIKSGEIHFYNTKTNKRTFQDPRAASATKRLPVGGDPCLSLDLKLNLAASDAAPAISTRRQHYSQRADGNNGEVKVKVKADDRYKYCSKSSRSRRRSSSWISIDADQAEEMVAAVCTRCHMLVMMCKATPSCPNCKFVHPPPRPI